MKIQNEIQVKSEGKQQYFLDFNQAISHSNKHEVIELQNRHKNLYVQMIQLTNSVLKKAQVTYWIDYGTLLGATRNGKVIPHDHDIDFCFIGDEDDFNRVAELFKASVSDPIQFYTKDNGYSRQHKLIHKDMQLNSLIKTKEDPDVYLASVDLYYYLPDKNGLAYNHTSSSPAAGIAHYTILKEHLYPIKEIKIQEIVFPCPNKITEHLTLLYGYLGEDCYYDYQQHKYKKIPEK